MNNTDKVIEILREFGVFRNEIPSMTELARLNSLTELSNKINSLYQQEVSADLKQLFAGYKKTKKGSVDEYNYEKAIIDMLTPTTPIESEQCKHEEKLMQGNGFVYTVCAKCGEDLDTIESGQGKEEWISVKDRLPNTHTRIVFVYVKTQGVFDTNIYTAQYFDDTEVWSVHDYESTEDLEVTHWRELPPAPRPKQIN